MAVATGIDSVLTRVPAGPAVSIPASGQDLGSRDRDFLERVIRTPPEAYLSRIQAIGFVNGGCVLDAGCGFGQWSAALARTNEHVIGIEVNAQRVTVARELLASVQNATLVQGSVETLPLAAESVDSIFSYSVIYYTNPRKTLREMHRVLKPDGRVYVCTNGWGWYLYNLMESNNPSADFSPRRYALETYAHTLYYWLARRTKPGRSIVTPSDSMSRMLRRAGFSVEALKPEGTINYSSSPIVPNFQGRYMGLENVYELIAVKR